MKRIYIVYLLLVLVASSCAQQGMKGVRGNRSVVLTAVATQQDSIASPYTIELVDTKVKYAPGLQSYGMAVQGQQWLLVGGRTNGFHGTADSSSAFPTRYSNKNMFVIDMAAQKTYQLAIPAAYKLQLQSTNMACIQDGDYLYCAGGYGSTCATDSPGCYQTFPNLTAINVPAAITAITSGDTAALANAITTITDEHMRVTGGALRKIGDWFYLVMGQNYNQQYKGAVTGIYTEQVRKFNITNTNGQLSISNYIAYDAPWDTIYKEQFHRRDLTVAQTIMDDGSAGISVYGGVFTVKGGSGYQNPVYISQDNEGNTAFALDMGFAQKLNLYECATVVMYDSTTQNLYTSLIGGITYYYYDKFGILQESNLLNFLPFSNNVTTIVRSGSASSRTSVEYPQQTPALPGYIGSDAEFIPAGNLPKYNHMEKVLDYAQLPAGKTLIGWMYGGILSTANQSNGFNPTYANNRIYEVYIVK
jgi:hypothetical protein